MRLRFSLLILLAASTLPVPARAGDTAIGLLDCVVRGGTGFIIGSTKSLACTFRPADGTAAPERYVGVINRLGLDLGYTRGATVRWTVLAPEKRAYRTGEVAGRYEAPSAEVTAGVGAAASSLLHGDKGLSLLPRDAGTSGGLSIAVGVSQIQLRPDRSAP